MAKISRPILEYRDVMKSSGIKLDDYKPTKKTMQRFIRIFRNIEDTRIKLMIDYPLYEILLIAFLAVLGSATCWTEIEEFGLSKKKWLKKFLPLKNGIPSHDTFRRVFSLIDPLQLQKATVHFLIENIDSLKKSLGIKSSDRQICIDGKEERGTGRKYGTDEEIRNLQTLHVYDASNGICLFSQAINKKTNEIPVAQKIIKMMQLKDSIVSFDSMHTQTKTISLIVERGGNYVGALKGNQENLEIDASGCFPEEIKKKIREKGNDFYEMIEKAHNQVETRRFYLAKAGRYLSEDKEWQNLRNFICYDKKMFNVVTGKETKETRYYITSLRDIELCADTIRGHWSVENQLHWHLDVNFSEDDNTTIDRQAFTNLSILNKMALSMSKLAQPLMRNSSIRTIRKKFSWNFEDHLGMLLNVFDENVIKKALEEAGNKKK